MNKVNYCDKSVGVGMVDLSTSERRKWHIVQGHTAFIGHHPWRKELELYLVVYNEVALASAPNEAWDTVSEWIVNRWVDIEINVLN